MMSVFYEMWDSGWGMRLLVSLIVLLIVLLLMFIPALIWKTNQFNERCEAENGWVLSKHHSSFCLSEDGRILF